MGTADVIVGDAIDELGPLEVLLAGTVKGDIDPHRDIERSAALDGMKHAQAPVGKKMARHRLFKSEVGAPEPTDGDGVPPVETAAALLVAQVEGIADSRS